MNALSQIYPHRVCEPDRAIRHFLAAMKRSADATFPAWREMVKAAVEECRLPYENRREIFDSQPLTDLYFAGIVGMEVAKLRGLYANDEATELLVEIGERVDAVAERPDRLVSSLVFDIVSRIELLHPNQYKLPHDQVVRLILERMGWQALPETRALLGNILLRHQLGEPLACHVPAWWNAFHARFALLHEEGTTPVHTEEAITRIAPPVRPKRVRARQIV